MSRNVEPITGLEADPSDPEDFAVSARGVEAALAERRQRRGRPAIMPDARREKVSIRLSPRVLHHFRAGGPGWQTRVNDALERLVDGAG